MINKVLSDSGLTFSETKGWGKNRNEWRRFVGERNKLIKK